MIYDFDKRDIGCWADVANGEEHRRATLADLLRKLHHVGTAEAVDCNKLIAALVEELSDDYSEEDDAIATLQAHTVEGLLWLMHDGDLILTDETEMEGT